MDYSTGAPQRRLRRMLVLALVGVVGLTVSACTVGAPAAPVGAAGIVERTVAPGKPVSDEAIPLLTVGIPGNVPTLNPLDNIASGIYVNMLGLETLLRLDADGELQPWLATGYEKKSDTIYEYTLRKGVRFWDGSELTAQDVKDGWSLRLPGEPKASAGFVSVAKIEAPDDYTVRVTLSQPDATWESVPAQFHAVIFESDFYQKNSDTFGQPGTLLVGTGPWRIDSLDPTTGMELSANADYWGGKPPIERISVRSFADDNSMALALRSGEIDIAPKVNEPRGFDAAAGGGTTTTVPTCASALLSMPTQTEPWDDPHVRKAVAYALNRDDVIAATQGRAGGPLETLISPILLRTIGSEDEVETALATVPVYDFDLEGAKAEIAASSVPEGFSDSISVSQGTAAVAQVIAAQLAEIGIDLEIESMGVTEWTAAVTGPPEQRPLTWTETGACAPDPSWDDMWLTTGPDGQASGVNIANYTPHRMGELMREGRLTVDPAARLGIYTEMLQMLAEDLPYIPLYAEGTTMASKKYTLADYGSFWMNSPWALNLVAK